MNLFFLLNIIRVLVTKLRDTHRAESNMYMKAVRATLILVPLLGIQFVIFPWRPENRLAGEVYEYIMHILMHYQVGTELTAHICQCPWVPSGSRFRRLACLKVSTHLNLVFCLVIVVIDRCDSLLIYPLKNQLATPLTVLYYQLST